MQLWLACALFLTGPGSSQAQKVHSFSSRRRVVVESSSEVVTLNDPLVTKRRIFDGDANRRGQGAGQCCRLNLQRVSPCFAMAKLDGELVKPWRNPLPDK
jgi:hypothetical protein